MAFSAVKNQALFDRLRNFAAMLQNAREEGARLAAIRDVEAKPGGVDDAAFVDTSIATKAAALNLLSMADELRLFFENGPLSQFNRKDYLVPFVDTTQAQP